MSNLADLSRVVNERRFFFYPLLSLGGISVSVLIRSTSNFQQRGHLGRETVLASPMGSAHGGQAATLGRNFSTTLRTQVPTSSIWQQRPKEMQHLGIFWPSMWSQLWWGLAYVLAFHWPFTLCDSVTFFPEWQRWVVASALSWLPGLAVRWCAHQSPCGLLAGWTVCVWFLISAGLSHTPRMNVTASVLDNENQFKRVNSGFCLRHTVLPMPQAGHPTHKGCVPE